tara:strand:+ start:6694 stop:7554 length:861 start_codon:yes stop_codon:yes gene_type:complete
VKRKNKKRRIHKKHVAFLFITLASLAATSALGWILYVVSSNQANDLGRLVTFYDRGQERVILTHADTVKNALEDASIPVDSHDVVEPSINSKLLSSDSAIIIYRSRPILVIDGAARQKVITAAAAPREIVKVAGFASLGNKDKATFNTGSLVTDGASKILTIKRAVVKPKKPVFQPKPNALTRSKGAHIYTDSDGVAHRETYYDLPMNIVINHCGGGNSYSIRAADGAKIDKDGYVLVAANYGIYPRCSIVETSMGPGKVYDTGGFALRYPHGFDLATDWTNYDGR